MEKLEKGKIYAWCSCGKSNNQPWCNGAHQGTNFNPIVFTAEETKDVAICGCKQTKNPPYCDGSHASL
ncbi:MAG: CDGSH iron-sulfur domain-containing protein [Flavobacteriales bacterium]|nr:CDGSH iron-sulfur domain-containing protein [Flavobacteriales bacterium]